MANPKIDVEIGAKIDKLKNGLTDAEGSLQKFGKSATRLGKGLSLAVTLPLVAIGAAAVKTASDFEETAAKFDTVFRDIQKSADVAFKDLRNNFGLSSRASKELLGNTGDLLTGFGFTQKAALQLSTEVNKLAVDLASFTNFSGGAKGASDALTKALLGERESVKALGISILEEDVKKQVAINTAKGLIFETERQAKAQATLDLAIQQSGNAIGDYARTSGSFANQTRLLQARIEDLSNSFGEILLPFANKIVVGFNNIVKSFLSLDEGTRKTIVLISGLAAAIGPLSLAIGGIISALPILTAGFAVLTGPIGLTVIGLTALGTALFAFVTNTDLGIQATAKYEKALDTFTVALNKVSDAQKIVDDFNNSSVEKTPELIESTKGRIKARIEEARATLLQAKAEAQLAIEEAKKESVLDFLIGFERVQRRVNKVQGEAAEKISGINKSLNELTVSYLKLGTDATNSTNNLNNAVEDLDKTFGGADFIDIYANRVLALNDALNQTPINKLEEVASRLTGNEIGFRSDDPFGISEALGEKAPIEEDTENFTDALDKIKSKALEVGNAFSGLGALIGSAFNNVGLGQFLGQFTQFVAKIVIGAFAVSKANAIAGATQSSLFTGPAAVFTLPAFIASSVGLVASAFAGIKGGGSSGGGVGSGVSGTSFQGQGATAFNGNREIFGELVVRGNDLVYVFDQSRDKIAKG